MTASALVLAQLGASDCEAMGEGLLAQPVNAVTSLAYVVVGGAILVLALRRRDGGLRSFVLVAALVATGIGSVAFHGPQPTGAGLAHDLPIVAMLGIMAIQDVALVTPRFRPGPSAPVTAGVVVVALAVVVPAGVAAVTAALLAVVVVAEVVVQRTGLRPGSGPARRRAEGALWVTAAVAAGAWLLGRTGAPGCDADSLLQLHGAWHVLSALAIGLWWWLALPGEGDRVSPP